MKIEVTREVPKPPIVSIALDGQQTVLSDADARELWKQLNAIYGPHNRTLDPDDIGGLLKKRQEEADKRAPWTLGSPPSLGPMVMTSGDAP